jgi:hypothetical protein
MTEPPTSDYTPPVLPDRRTPLIIFGVLGILIGVLFLLPALASFSVLFLPAEDGLPAVDGGQVALTVITFLGLSLLMVITGLGSIRARRWARVMIQLTSGTWLMMVMVTAALIPYMMSNLEVAMPQEMAELGQGVDPGLMGSALAIAFGFYAIPPLVMFFFYRSEATRATCERINPQPSWTDLAPIQILVLCKLLVIMALGNFGMMFLARAPLLGLMLTGPAAVLLNLVGGLVFLLVALAAYQRVNWALPAAFVTGLLLQLSWLITMGRMTYDEFYEKLYGIPLDPALEGIEPDIWQNLSVSFSVMLCLVWAGYILYLWKNFGPAPQEKTG